MQLKPIAVVLVILAFTSCSEIKEVATNTKETAVNTNYLHSSSDSNNVQLQQIQRNTKKLADVPIELRIDSMDLLSNMIAYEELYSRNVTWDSSWVINQQWLGFRVNTLERTGDQILKKSYSGVTHVANPKNLFVQKQQSETVSKASLAMETKHKSVLFADRLTYRSIGNLTSKEWNELLMREKIFFDGTHIEMRNFNYSDLNRISLNNASLFKDTLYKIKATSSSTVSQASNTYNDLFISSCYMLNADIKNWFFVSSNPLQLLWTDSKFLSSDMNDVSYQNINIYNCSFDNVIIRNTNSGGFDNASISSCSFINGQWEDVRITNSKFTNTKIDVPQIWRGYFNQTQFMGTSGFRSNSIGGVKFTGCTFYNPSSMDAVKVNGVEFVNCNLSALQFVNQCDLTDVRISGGTIGGTKFNNTILERVSFGDPTSTYLLNFSGTDLRTAVFRQSSVVFYRCDLTNALLPSTSYLQANGVKFINCTGAPYNSTL